MNSPLSPREGLAAILSRCSPGAPLHADLTQSVGLVAAASVLATMAVPPFDNSSMDGFAVFAADCEGASETSPVFLRVAGTVPAGSIWTGTDQAVEAGWCVEIMTGAPLPPGTDAVVPVEWTVADPDDQRPGGGGGCVVRSVGIRRPAAPGAFIRWAGADTAPGDPILAAGDVITPALVTLAASCGIARAQVFGQPRLALAVGGDEIVDAGAVAPDALRPGAIFDSNRPGLTALFAARGHHAIPLPRLPDDQGAIEAILRPALDEHDVVVTVGGVSMGRKDLVRPALAALGCDEVFWRLNQQPGGPMLFAAKGRKLVFGLPGNPVSAAVCAELYVIPALRALAGYPSPELPRLPARLGRPFAKTHGKVVFARATLSAGATLADLRIEPNGHQDSNRIRSMVGTVGFLEIPAEARDLPEGAPATLIVTDPDALLRALARGVATDKTAQQPGKA